MVLLHNANLYTHMEIQLEKIMLKYQKDRDIRVPTLFIEEVGNEAETEWREAGHRWGQQIGQCGQCAV